MRLLRKLLVVHDTINLIYWSNTPFIIGARVNFPHTLIMHEWIIMGL